ncbi:MAG: putative ATP-grasp-modified RiPP, partial [Pseudonocardiaceae bacterium]
MSGEPHGHSVNVGLFPSSDHFPLGRAYGQIDTKPEPASAARPFGLALAVPVGTVHRVDPAELGYDEDAQVGLIRDGVDMVPLSKHTDGQTSTVTQGGDGQTTNKDSDTDHRED